MPKTLHFTGAGNARNIFRIGGRAGTNHATTRTEATVGGDEDDDDDVPGKGDPFAPCRSTVAWLGELRAEYADFDELRRRIDLRFHHRLRLAQRSLSHARKPETRARAEAELEGIAREAAAARDSIELTGGLWRLDHGGHERGVFARYREPDGADGESFTLAAYTADKRVLAEIRTPADPELAAVAYRLLKGLLHRYDPPVTERPARNGLAIIDCRE